MFSEISNCFSFEDFILAIYLYEEKTGFIRGKKDYKGLIVSCIIYIHTST